jgi:hypothetical protein
MLAISLGTDHDSTIELAEEEYLACSSSSISLSCDRSIASSKVLERDCPGKVIMW